MMRGKGKRYLALLMAACMFLSLPALHEYTSIAEEQAAEAAPAPAEEKPKEAAPAESKPQAPAVEEKPAEKPAEPAPEKAPAAEEKPEAPAPTQAPAEKPAETKAPAKATPTPSPTPSPSPTAEPEKPEATPAPENPDAPVVTIAPEVQPAPSAAPEGTAPEATPGMPPEENQPTAEAAPAASPEATAEAQETMNPEATLEVEETPEPTPSPTPEPPSFEMLSRSKSYSNNHLDAGSLRIPKNGMPIPLLYQYDYGRAVCRVSGKDKSVASSGCGAASASMLIAYIAQDYDQTPYSLFYWAAKNGRYRGDGLDFATVKQMLSNYGVRSKLMSVSADGIMDALRADRPVIILMGPGTFTKGGHYIVLRGLDDDGNVLVNDPNSSGRSAQGFSAELIAREAKNGYMLVAYPHAEDADADVAEEAVIREGADAGMEIPEAEAPETSTAVPEMEVVIQALETEASVAPVPLETVLTDESEAAETPAPAENAAAVAELIVEAEITIAPEVTRAPFSGRYCAVVSVDSANLRTAPGSKGKVVDLVVRDTLLCVVDEKVMSSGNVWCGVAYGGETLYLPGKYLVPINVTAEEMEAIARSPVVPAAETVPAEAAIEPAATPEPTPVPTAVPEIPGATEDGAFEAAYLAQVCADRVNLREAPGSEGLIVSSVPMGTALCVVGEERCDADGYVWCAVIWQKQTLYMRGDMLAALE